MTLYFRRRLLFRVLALLMMFLILALVSVVPIMQAAALAPVIAYGVKELVAALLIAGGASFATTDTARDAAAKVWDWLGQQASGVADKLQQIVALQIDVANTVGDGAVRISQSIWDAINDAYQSFVGSSVGGDIAFGEPIYFADGDAFDNWADNIDFYTSWITSIQQYDADGNLLSDAYILTPYIDVGDYYTYVLDGEEYHSFFNGDVFGRIWFSPSNSIRPFFWLNVGNSNDTALSFGGNYAYFLETPCYVVFGTGAPSLAPDLTYPGEDTMIYVPDIPEVQTDEEGKDVVIWPDLSLNPDDFVLDIPKTATGDLVDVPYDTLVDASTGTAVGEGEGTGTGEGEGTGSGILDILGDIWDAIRNFFDSPSDFKLDFDGFKNLILVDRFPFCIPFDLRDAIMLFAASAADYKFSIDLDTSYFSVHHTVDLSPYTVPITFFRYVVVVWFVYVLILRTRDVMKW